MLVQRVITAIVLLAVLLATLLAPNAWPLVILLIAGTACALWEWLRLTWPSDMSRGPLVISAVVAALLAIVAVQWLAVAPAHWALGLQRLANQWLLPVVAIIWVVFGTAIVVRGHVSAPRASVPLTLFAVLATVAVWAALVELFLAHGPWFLVSLLALIWLADIAAYFSGKAFGKHKLAPKVSPGKTWEGAIGGVAAGTAWLVVSSYWEGSFGAVLREYWPGWAVVLIAVFLTALSIIGDLFESLLKRRAGVKDSSQLLPGHGGVYDRIDALLPVAPFALLLTGAWLQ